MQMIFVVIRHDGGGSCVIGHFAKLEDAKVVANKLGEAYGQPCASVEETPLFESLAEMDEHGKQRVRARALAKLTAEEAAALGIAK